MAQEASTSNGASPPTTTLPHRSTFFHVAIFIIIMETMERLTYYGLSTNMVVYLWTYLGFNKGDATAMKMAWTGVAYTAPVFGSICADSFFGRYTVIKYVGMLYTAGRRKDEQV